MSKGPPAFQLYAADFYMDTVGWSCEEVGLYFRLLMAQWVNGSIPDDIEKIARIGGCNDGRKWRSNVARMWSQIGHKFIKKSDGNLVNIRLEKTREEQNAYIEIQREKGKKRASEMWKDHIAVAKNRLQPEVQPEDSSSSSTSLKEKEKINKKEKVSPSYTNDFLTFWSEYPKKVGKDAAWKSWKARNGTRPPIADLVTAIRKQTQSDQWNRDNGQYIPNPSTWLNQGRWSDDIKSLSGGNGNGRNYTGKRYGRSEAVPEASLDALARAEADYERAKASAPRGPGRTSEGDDVPDFAMQ